MANFDVQVESLVGQGTTLTDAEVAQWMNDGAREIINVLPEELLYKTMKTTTLNGDTPTITYGGVEAKARILEVLRLDADSGGFEQPCIRVHSTMYGKINDPYSIYYATYNTPAYIIHNNILSISPPPTNTQTASVCHVDFPALVITGGGTSDITAQSSIPSFPNEAEYLVVLYAAIKALQNKMSEMHTSTTINTALLAITDAVGQAEIAAAKFASATSDSQFDTNATWDATNSQLTIVKEALDKAKTLMSDDASYNALSGVTDDVTNVSALYWLGEEDTEMVQSVLNMVQVEIQRAQTEVSHWTAIGDMRTKEINAALSEAGGYVQEVSTIMSRDNQKYQWLQSEQAKLQQDYDKGLQMLVTPRGVEKNAN